MPEVIPAPHDEYKEFFGRLDLYQGVNVVVMPTIEGAHKTVPFENGWASGDTETRVPTDEEAQGKLKDFFTELKLYLTTKNARYLSTLPQNTVDAKTGQFKIVNYLILEKT